MADLDKNDDKRKRYERLRAIAEDAIDSGAKDYTLPKLINAIVMLDKEIDALPKPSDGDELAMLQEAYG